MIEQMVKSDIRNTTLRRANSCWTCKFGIFNRRTSSSIGRLRGNCLVGAGEYPWPRSWVIPATFWLLLNANQFEGNDWHEYLKWNAVQIYGNRLALELENSQGLYLDMIQVRQEWEWMQWIASNSQETTEVSSLEVCDLYQSPKD